MVVLVVRPALCMETLISYKCNTILCKENDDKIQVIFSNAEMFNDEF